MSKVAEFLISLLQGPIGGKGQSRLAPEAEAIVGSLVERGLLEPAKALHQEDE